MNKDRPDRLSVASPSGDAGIAHDLRMLAKLVEVGTSVAEALAARARTGFEETAATLRARRRVLAQVARVRALMAALERKQGAEGDNAAARRAKAIAIIGYEPGTYH